MSKKNAVTKSFSLDEETIKRIEKMAELTDRQNSAMVRVCVNDFYERNFEIVLQKENTAS
jgi:predicted transcriptional regulator